jgi:hypothetical protein
VRDTFLKHAGVCLFVCLFFPCEAATGDCKSVQKSAEDGIQNLLSPAWCKGVSFSNAKAHIEIVTARSKLVALSR